MKEHTSRNSASSSLNPTTPGPVIVPVDASFAPLIPRFMANRKQEVISMQEALAAQDFESLRTIAHGMKGAGGSYGFTAITTMGATIEAAAKQRLVRTIEEELLQLGSYLDRVDVIFIEETSEA